MNTESLELVVTLSLVLRDPRDLLENLGVVLGDATAELGDAGGVAGKLA